MTNVTHNSLLMYLFLFLTLYMFRAHRAPHQERQIVSIQPLVTVTLCRCPYRVQVGSELTCASRWSFTKNHNMMHGQQNVKFCTFTSLRYKLGFILGF